jgi:hypothetical protein
MDTVADFEDLLVPLQRHEVRYLVIGGLAFIYHARPRYTKDMDLWIDPSAAKRPARQRRPRRLGSPHLLTLDRPAEILQLGLPPNRIDLLRLIEGSEFALAWRRRVKGKYGRAEANWMDLDTLIDVKSRIDDPRHRRDVRDLERVRALRAITPMRRTSTRHTSPRRRAR